ncbi:MAG: trimethylamine methyltransferase family protein, partial [Paracoccaceae bacterium]
RNRAYERWTTLLNQYEPPPIDETTDEALNDFVARRKSELPDAWY